MAPTTRSQSRRSSHLVKLLRTGRTHHGYTYVPGLNVCPDPWTDEDLGGGLYACELRYLPLWLGLYPDITEVAWVQVPAGAKVRLLGCKIKADRLVLSEFMPLADAFALAIAAGADIEDEEDSPLRWAASSGNTEAVRLLLAAGADVHALNDAALRGAVELGRTECVRLLLTAYTPTSDPYLINRVLYMARANGHKDVVRLLRTFRG